MKQAALEIGTYRGKCGRNQQLQSNTLDLTAMWQIQGSSQIFVGGFHNVLFPLLQGDFAISILFPNTARRNQILHIHSRSREKHKGHQTCKRGGEGKGNLIHSPIKHVLSCNFYVFLAKIGVRNSQSLRIFLCLDHCHG